MRYTVIESRIAQNALAYFWRTAVDRQAVSDASDKIDRLLKSIPEQCGVPFMGLRRLTVPPLEVLCQVLPDDCLVRIWSYRLVP
jgi:hypothetical protein